MIIIIIFKEIIIISNFVFPIYITHVYVKI